MSAFDCIKCSKALLAEHLAGSLYTYGTALHALKDIAQIKKNEVVVISGAAGGVGLAGIDIAKDRGAYVVALASSEEKRELCLKAGADEALDYTSIDIKKTLKTYNNNLGVDVIMDQVGGDFSKPALRALKRLGRFLVIGFASGAIPKIPLNLPLLKECSIAGVFWGGSFRMFDQPQFIKNNQDIITKIETGNYKPVVYKALDINHVKQGFELIASRQVKGKVVITF